MPIHSLFRFTNCNILSQNSPVNILSDAPTLCLCLFFRISPSLLFPLYAFYTHTNVCAPAHTHIFLEPFENSCRLWNFSLLFQHESNKDILLHNYNITNILKSLIFIQYYHLIQHSFHISLVVPK